MSNASWKRNFKFFDSILVNFVNLSGKKEKETTTAEKNERQSEKLTSIIQLWIQYKHIGKQVNS